MHKLLELKNQLTVYKVVRLWIQFHENLNRRIKRIFIYNIRNINISKCFQIL